jgi:eukaryotic-like serine/threonine-protein kinase
MSLGPGARLGPYEIQSALGAGGMGEVYRARDTRLKRDVALKLLTASFATDPDRLARFQREAEVLASLNHPHIAAIHGLEESDGTRALVMELVEGETLADRIARGPIPVDEALPIAKQIAEALEAAHEQGIIHRDLKPANIKVRPDGTVKVLDFGLAKLAETGQAGRAGADALSLSPTITSPAMMTGIGVLLGTAAYMSPEQARGKVADKRSDIWAFGCVFYEMLTGRRVFDAAEVSDTLAMVLMKEVDWTPLPATTPPGIRTLLRRCLEKNRPHRLPDIGSARLEIDETLAVPTASITAPVETTKSRAHATWIVAALAGVAVMATAAAVVLAWLHFTEPLPMSSSPVRFSVAPPAGMVLTEAGGQWLSPDGRHVTFRVALGGDESAVKLAVRSFDDDKPRILAGTEGVGSAFWSPDSRFIGFFAAGKLQKIDVTGGPPQVLCELRSRNPGPSAGGTWNSDGTILFSSGEPGSGLFRVSSAGGTPAPVTKPDPTRNEQLHQHPKFLPDGREFLYLVTTSKNGALLPARRLYIGSLDGDPPMPLMQVDAGAQYADGHVLFVRDGTLLAQPFDTARRTTTGDPIVVAQDVLVLLGAASANFSVSSTGVLSYRTTSSTGVASQLVWFDRSGKVLGTIGEKTDQSELQLSPDGTRVSVSVLDPSRQTRDIWIHDLTRNGMRTRFTFDAGEDWRSVWSPDGRSLAYSAGRPSPLDLYRKPSDGSGVEERLLESGGNKYISSWSADGRFLLYGTGAGGSPTATDIWVLPLTGERKPFPFVQTPFSDTVGRFSPDGRWVAHNSNESGRLEVYVVPFPMAGGKWQISTGGGEQPRWRRDGKELFYLNANVVMAAEVNGTGAAFQVGAVRRLFEIRRRTESYQGFGLGSAYDVTPDGQRFLVNVVEQAPMPPPITVITNWRATLR